MTLCNCTVLGYTPPQVIKMSMQDTPWSLCWHLREIYLVDLQTYFLHFVDPQIRWFTWCAWWVTKTWWVSSTSSVTNCSFCNDLEWFFEFCLVWGTSGFFNLIRCFEQGQLMSSGWHCLFYFLNESGFFWGWGFDAKRECLQSNP